MIPVSATLDRDETEAVLTVALRERHGSDARLEAWTADERFTAYGKRKVVRYDLDARLAGDPRVRHFQWLGKFYDRDEDALRVEAVLRGLATNHGEGSTDIAVPSVIAYHPLHRLLVMTYEPGESVGVAIGRETDAILTALGRALATLHALPVAPSRITTPANLLGDLRTRVDELCERLPGAAASLRSEFRELERATPWLPREQTFVHGDFGPANLLWRMGQIVVLDFDKCAQGDPALDLGNLLTQLRRMTIRKPEKLRDFPAARAKVLEAYQRGSPPDPSLDRRVAWYEQAILLRKIHRLVFKIEDGEALHQRMREADRLLRLISLRKPLTDARSPGAEGPSGMRTGAGNWSARREPPGASTEGFPIDPNFPQLAVASDPRAMLDVFRTHLKPVAGKVYTIEDCVPFRFRCRLGTSRYVLQYTLRLAEPSTGRRWDQWVTGMLFAEEGKAERRWKKMQAWHPVREIPERWLTFEPVAFIPDLGMLVEVFPLDRRLRNLSAVVGGDLGELEAPLLARLGPGEWQVEDRSIEPMRYRTELGAALRYALRARDDRSGRVETVRCYLKVYHKEHGEDTLRLLRSFSRRSGDDPRAFSVIQPIAYLSRLCTLAFEEAAGDSLTHLLLKGLDGGDSFRTVAQAVAAFNQDTLPIGRQESLADQLDVVRTASALVAWACPETRAKVRMIVDAIVHGLDDVPAAPIHGDLKPDHIFLSGDRVIFIDLDRAVLGDPVRDPAHLFAYLVGRVGLDPVSPERAHRAAETFVEEYFRHVPESWRRRFPLHCAGALIEVASGIFARQESGWPKKIVGVVEAAHDALRETFEVTDATGL